VTDGEPDDLRRTQWGEVRALRGDADPTSRERAWRHLVERYAPAMVARARSVLKRLGGGVVMADDAEDVVAEFLADCVEKGWLDRADPGRGSFRAFVQTSIARRARDHVDARRAKKRTPESGPVRSLDARELAAAAGVESDPDLRFLESWAGCVVRSAIERVRARSPEGAAILDGLLEGRSDSADEARPRWNAAKFRARKMLAKELWSEVKDTVANAQELDEERLLLHPYLARYLDPDAAPSFFGGA
jgi:DNA-directed RNA polymerase specialized sigma24 family protein